MSIYRGPGGAGDAVNDASSEATLVSALVTEATAAKNAAEAAETGALAAQTAAETAETNAETAATNASSSASAASTSASSASSSASAASTSATNAASSASSASTSASSASSSASSASTSASNASTSATAAASSASSASTSATNASNSASAAATSASDAATLYDNFDDRYLGAKSSAPTVDNDGNTLLTGALYFNTSTNSMKVWSGSSWLDAYASLSGAVTSVSATAPVQSSGGTSPTISITQASGSANGYLSSTDWNTFNNKQAALVSGTSIKTVGGASLLGSGDAGTIGISYGGTGQTTKAAAFNALSPVTSTGDLIIGNGANSNTRLPIGTNGYLLTSDGTTAIWAAAPVSLPSQTGNSGKYLTTDGSTASWATVAAGNTTSKGLWENSNTITADYTIGTNYNAMSVGPVSVASGVTVTIPSGSNWMIL